MTVARIFGPAGTIHSGRRGITASGNLPIRCWLLATPLLSSEVNGAHAASNVRVELRASRANDDLPSHLARPHPGRPWGQLSPKFGQTLLSLRRSQVSSTLIPFACLRPVGSDALQLQAEEFGWIVGCR